MSSMNILYTSTRGQVRYKCHAHTSLQKMPHSVLCCADDHALGIWTKAIGEVMGMPGARAIDIYNSAWGGEAQAVREKLGICFVGQQYFGGQNAKNQFGSTQYKNGDYDSWTAQRTAVAAAAKGAPKQL